MTALLFIHSGTVQSRNDRDRHYVTCDRVARLHGVTHCPHVRYVHAASYPVPVPDGARHLWPRSDGKYERVEKTCGCR
jgi:hypothetical protein